MSLSKEYAKKIKAILKEYEGEMLQLGVDELAEEKEAESNLQFVETVNKYEKIRDQLQDDAISSIQKLFKEFTSDVKSEVGTKIL